ncbi:LytR/AlgR family response regulator transcription factor [Hwangdonia sp.]|uniref:LytR/AlgR family response regulator transcription factor n=1 Tax=Hwangdonia sp. TaxID=1883432 RepID=UPI003AB7AD2A
MIKAILIDDELHCTERLQTLLLKYSDNIHIIGVYHNVEDAKNSIEKLKPNLVFLDIHLNESTAFDLLKSLKQKKFQIIFTTAYDKYAIEAIKFSAFDYLLKPIDSFELKDTLARLKNTTNSHKKLDALFYNTSKEVEKKIIIATEKETFFLNISDIVRCKADGSYTTFFLANGKSVIASKTLKHFDELLSTYAFYRTHQSHLINTKFIGKNIKGTNAYVIMNDKSEIPIAKRRKEDFLNTINEL